MKNPAPMKGDTVVLPRVECIRLKRTVDVLATNVGEVTLQTRGGSVPHPSPNTRNTTASGLLRLCDCVHVF